MIIVIQLDIALHYICKCIIISIKCVVNLNYYMNCTKYKTCTSLHMFYILHISFKFENVIEIFQ